ncbi:hypothetical protein, partial [Pontiella sp.]|uniref:hypothetical protein n=1 Tax=Pontiella sp. TaxID=2837462 RepID=UPI0035661638
MKIAGITGMALALGLSGAAHAAPTVALPAGGGTAGFHESGANATGFRTFGTGKSFDLNGDDIYGSQGYFFFGVGGTANVNSQPFSRNTQDLPSWVTSVDAGANFSSVAEYDTYSAIDNPTLPPTSDTEDWVRSGMAVATGSGVGTWTELVTFTIDSTAPTTFRVGLMTGNEGSTDGRWSPTGLRLSVNGGTAVEVTGLPDLESSNVGMVFFDVTTDGSGGTFSVEGQQRLATQGSSLTGITFDETSESYWPGGMLEVDLESLSLELIAPETSVGGTITASYIAGSTSSDVEIVSLTADAGFSASVVSSTLGTANLDEEITVSFDNASIGLAHLGSTNSTLVVSWTEPGSGVTNTIEVALDVIYYSLIASPNVIAGYDFDDGTGNATRAVTEKNAYVTASDFGVGDGLFDVIANNGNCLSELFDAEGYVFGTANPFSYGDGRSPFGFTDMNNANNLEMAIATNDYMVFTITPTNGYAMDLTSFSFRSFAKTTNHAAERWALFSSVGGFAIDDVIAIGQNMEDAVYVNHVVDLSGAAFQELEGSIEFRLYIYGGNESYSAATQFDKVIVRGDVYGTA